MKTNSRVKLTAIDQQSYKQKLKIVPLYANFLGSIIKSFSFRYIDLKNA